MVSGAAASLASGQMLIKPLPDPGNGCRVFYRGKDIVLVGNNGAFRYDKERNVAVPIEGFHGSPIPSTSGFNGNQMWIRTTEGVFRYDWQSHRASFVDGGTGVVSNIIVAGSEFWLTGEHGLFRYDAQHNKAIRASGPDSTGTYELIKDELWVAADSDDEDGNDDSNKEELTYRCNLLSYACSMVRGVFGAVDHIEFLLGNVWLASESGVFRYDLKQNTLSRIDGYSEDSGDMSVVGDTLWLYTPVDEEEAYEENPHPHVGSFATHIDLEHSRAIHVQGNTGHVWDVVSAGGETWILGENNTFRYDPAGNAAIPLSGETGDVNQILQVGRDALIAADKGLFKWDKISGRAEPVQSSSSIGKVSAITLIGSDVWLTGNSLSRYDQTLTKVVPVGGLSGTDTYTVLKVGQDIWIKADRQGEFVFNRDQNRAVPMFPGANTGSISRVLPTGDGIWLEAGLGAFHYDPDGQISIDVHTPVSWLARLTNLHLWTSGTATLTANYPTPNSPEVDVIVATSVRDLLQKTQSGGHWVNIQERSFQVAPGWSKLYVAYKDAWGNIQTSPDKVALSGFAIPTWSFLSGLIVFLGILGVTLCFFLAPYSRMAQLVLMNPFLRSVGSFGLIPIVLTLFAPARRHLFLRYRRKLAADEALSQAAREYLVPAPEFEAQPFMQALIESDRRIAVIQGPSGIGKFAFMRYLAHSCADSRHGNSYIPVPIDLSSMTSKIKDAIAGRLRKFGEITDASLVDAFLNNGGFLLLLDGFNELSKDAMNEVLEFVDVNREHNLFCITLQVTNKELSTLGALKEIAPLDEAKVDELVRRTYARNAASGAEDLLQKFTAVTYRICRIPIQLELVLDIWQRQGKLPESLDVAFKDALSSVLDPDKWGEEHADYPRTLAKVAYKLLTEKKTYDPKSREIPQPILDELIDRKMLVTRGEVMEFRHAKIQAYLAFLYFKDHWNPLLSDSRIMVDQNWDSMLQFHMSQEQQSSTARGILLLLLDRDYETAVRCFAWIRYNRPELSRDWHGEFNLALAKKVADAVPVSIN